MGNVISAGSFGMMRTPVSDRIQKIDKDENNELTVQELSEAADSDGDGQVSQLEADTLFDELGKLDTENPGTLEPGVLDKMKKAVMDPVRSDVIFEFTQSRYSSVFCTRF